MSAFLSFKWNGLLEMDIIWLRKWDGEINYSFNLDLCKADVELGMASSPVLAFTNPAKKLNWTP